MAISILTNCVVTVNGTDFSDHVSSIELTLEKDDVDITTFGGNGKERKAGLQDNSIQLNFFQDFEAGEVDAVLFPLWNNATEFTVTVKPAVGAIATNNPEYQATCILLEYSPLNGSVGDASETSVTFPVQRNTLVRDTTP